ncbi:MAG: neutral zinc metallopeptidase [Gemmatimonadaceae bacterium]
MRWSPGGSRRNVDDLRGAGGGGMFGGGGGMFGGGGGGGGMLGGGRRLGCGGLLVLLVLSFVFKTDLFSLLGGGGGTVAEPVPGAQAPPAQQTADEAKLADFVTFVLNDVQAMWAKTLPTVGTRYQDARLVLFRNAVRSECGVAQSAMGPFYCPADGRVYIDLGFYEELRRRFGAPGDFAQAYVIAHELGHHVQNLLGTSQQVTQEQRQRPDAANALSVRLELQADCYAGVWANAASDSLETGDVEEGLAAAAAVGDDRMQQGAGRSVNSESFTHGSAAQRASWFRRGLQNGRPQDCDTFARSSNP